LPFVTRAEELRRARQLIEDLRAQLGVPSVPVGAMIEVPSAALTVDLLAPDAEFLSVGTNDLIQYTLAVDRADEAMLGSYEPTSPAVLRLLSRVVAAARRAAREVYVCGEMAADPRLMVLLVGLGFRALSATPAALPAVKRALASVDTREARTLARRALRARADGEVNEMLSEISKA
jgi:phosphoenolpyruvate-protein kinase (PTS system EI component)